MQGLRDKIAIVTGGASGIGRAEAELLARYGAKVVIADLDVAAGESVVSTLRAGGAEALCVPTDVGDAASVEDLVTRARAHFGGVDLLFTNAANVRLINTRDASCLDLEEAVFDEIHRVVMRGVFLCAKYCGRAMVERGGGAMVFTATTDAHIGCAGLDAYTAAKGGVVAMTRSLAAALASKKIRVNAISPGFVNTPHQASFLSDPVLRHQIESLHLLPVPDADAIAPLAVFLASDDARAITGSIHPVDAGYTAFKTRAVDVMQVINRGEEISR